MASLTNAPKIPATQLPLHIVNSLTAFRGTKEQVRQIPGLGTDPLVSDQHVQAAIRTATVGIHIVDGVLASAGRSKARASAVTSLTSARDYATQGVEYLRSRNTDPGSWNDTTAINLFQRAIAHVAQAKQDFPLAK
jgi:hypothetical protein